MTSGPVSTDGQPLGQRGLRTRQRILEAVADGIEQQGLRGLRLADVAEEVGFSPPAFYQYFNDLDEAILALCEEVGAFIPAFPSPDDGWLEGATSSKSTQAFVERFFEYWDEHRAVLWSRNVAITAGDERFQEVRDETFKPVIDAMEARIEAAQNEGTISSSISPRSLGAVLTVMIDRIGMLAPQITETWGTEAERDLIRAVAFVFDRVLGIPPNGRAASQRSGRAANQRSGRARAQRRG